MLRRQPRLVVRLALAGLLGSSLPAAAQSQTVSTGSQAASTSREDDRPSVLLLIPVPPGRSLFDQFSRGVAAEFLSSASVPVALSVEHLFDATASAQVSARQFEFVRAKYEGQRIDAIVAVGHPRYLDVRERLGLSSHVPLVFVAEQASRFDRPANAVFIELTSTLVDSCRFLRPLLPWPHTVALLGGSASADRETNAATLAALRVLAGEQSVVDLTDRDLAVMRQGVEALPAGSVLLMGSVLSDREGRSMTYQVLLSAVAPRRRLPVVVATDTLLGHGALGGLLYRIQEVGSKTAAVTLRLLDGESADRIGLVKLAPSPVVDAQELARFGLSEARLPPETTVMGRMPTMWEAYRPWILGGLSLLVLQTVLIAGLLAERRRRRESQRQLAERLRLQALVATVSSEFANLPGDRLEARIEECLTQVGTSLGLDGCAIFTLDAPDESARLVSRWSRPAVVARRPELADVDLIARERARLAHRLEVHARDGHDPAAGWILLLPLAVDEQVIGTFVLRHAFTPDWSMHVLGDLRTIGEIIATAVVRKRTDVSMRQQLEALAHVNRIASLGELAASLAHELNQPLAAILSNAEVAQQLLTAPEPPLGELRDVVADVIADDERAGEIIRNMRSMLRRHDVAASVIDVNAVVSDVGRLVAHDARLRSGEVELSLGEAVPRVLMDATQLKQVLLNLVLNAVDAMASLHVRQPVEVRTRAQADGALIEVRDHGPGVPADVLPRLFDAFFTTKTDGLGVGLAITRSIVEAAGGRIAATNAPEGGAVFSVWFPAAQESHGAG